MIAMNKFLNRIDTFGLFQEILLYQFPYFNTQPLETTIALLKLIFGNEFPVLMMKSDFLQNTDYQVKKGPMIITNNGTHLYLNYSWKNGYIVIIIEKS